MWRHRLLGLAPTALVTCLALAQVASAAMAPYDVVGGKGIPLPGYVNPGGIALDRSGSLLVSDALGGRVFSISRAGKVRVLAGTGDPGFAGDGGPASRARLAKPAALLARADGSVLVADVGNNRIRQISADGVIRTVAGSGQRGFAGDGGPAANASLYLSIVGSLASDPRGGFDVPDGGNGRVRWVDANGVIRTIAGRDFRLGTGDPLNPFEVPIGASGLARRPNGALLIADSGNNVVYELAADGSRLSGFAGTGDGASGSCCYSGDGGPAAKAALRFPSSLAEGNGEVAIVDVNNRAVRAVNSAGIIHTVVGPLKSGTGIPTAVAQLPGGLYVGLSLRSGSVVRLLPRGSTTRRIVNITSARLNRRTRRLQVKIRSNRPSRLILRAGGSRWTRSIRAGTQTLTVTVKRGSSPTRVTATSAAGIVLSQQPISRR